MTVIPFPARPPRTLAEVFRPLPSAQSLFAGPGPGGHAPVDPSAWGASPVAFPGRADYSTTVPPAASPERHPPNPIPTLGPAGPLDTPAIAARLVVDLDEPTLAYLAAEAVMRGQPVRALVAATLAEIAACRMLSAVLDGSGEGGS